MIKKKLVVLIITIVIFFLSQAALFVTGRTIKETVISQELNLVPHDPIYIHGNGDFTPDNGITKGSGTANDPFIIEGWDICASLKEDGIRIDDTTAYFIIRNCYIHYINGIIASYLNPRKMLYPIYEDTKPYPMGIFLNNVTNGGIENCYINGTVQAICVNNSVNNHILNCHCYKNLCGIGVLASSHHNSVVNSSSQNYECGVCFYSNASSNIAKNCTASITTFLLNRVGRRFAWFGFVLWNSWDNCLYNCRSYCIRPLMKYFKKNLIGVSIKHSHNSEIQNHICHNLRRGIDIENSSSILMKKCQLLNNRWGIYISDKSVNNNILHNNFIRNHRNACDRCVGNLWNRNFWDDWIGLRFSILKYLPYHIPGRLLFNYDWNPKIYPQ